MATAQQIAVALRNAKAANDADAVRVLTNALIEADQREKLAARRAELERQYVENMPPREAGFFENVGTGFGAGFVGMGEMATLGAATLLEEESEKAAREKIKSAFGAITPEGGDKDALTYQISSGLGSIAGLFAPVAAAAALPVSAPVAAGIATLGAGALSVAAGAGEASERVRAYEEAEDTTVSEEERTKRVLGGAGIGAIGIIPFARVLRIPGVTKLANRVGGETVEGFLGRLRSAATTGTLEGATEAFEGFLQNLNEKGYNAKKELLDAGLIDEAIAGGGAGAIFQALLDVVTKGKTPSAPELGADAEPELASKRIDDLQKKLASRELSPEARGQLEAQLYDALQVPTNRRKQMEIPGVKRGVGLDAREEDLRKQLAELDAEIQDKGEMPLKDQAEYARKRGALTQKITALEATRAERTERMGVMAPEQVTAREQLAEPGKTDELFAQELEQAQRVVQGPPRPEDVTPEAPEPVTRREDVVDILEQGAEEASRERMTEPGMTYEMFPQELEAALEAPTPEGARRAPEPTPVPEAPTTRDPYTRDVIDELETEAIDLAVLEDEIAALDAKELEDTARGVAEIDARARAEVAAKPLTNEFLDTLGVAKRAGIRKLTDKKIGSPEVATAFRSMLSNNTVPEETKKNILEQVFVGEAPKLPQVVETPFLTALGVPKDAPLRKMVGKRVSDPKVRQALGAFVTNDKTTPEALDMLTQMLEEIPAAKPRGRKPKPQATEQPTGKPTGEQPTGKPTGEQPTGKPTGKPTGEQPTGEQPTGEQPTGEQPTGEQPTGKPRGRKSKPKAETETETPVAPPLTTQMLDDLGVSKTAAIRKMADKGKTLDDTDVQDALVKLTTNPKVKPEVKQRINKTLAEWLAKKRGTETPTGGKSETETEKPTGKPAGGKKTTETSDQVPESAYGYNLSAVSDIAGLVAKLQAMQAEVLTDAKLSTAQKTSRNNSLQSKIDQLLDNLDANTINKELDLLPVETQTALDTPMADTVTEALRAGDLTGALRQLADSTTNNRVAQIAKKLSNVAGTTKVKLVKNLKNDAGVPVLGVFDPETNTIKLDADEGVTAHALLHETTHAAVSATLDKPGHPLTKQLTALFDSVKDRLGTAYGAQDVQEFAAEALSNIDFQTKLARLTPKGSPITAWQKFSHSVRNFVRKLLGMDTKPIDSALTEVDRLIDGLMAPAPEYRGSPEMALMGTRAGARKLANSIDGIKRSIGQLTPEARRKFTDSAVEFFGSTVNDNVKQASLGLLGSQALGDVAKAVGLGDIGLRLHRLMGEQRGAMSASDVRVEAKVKDVQEWFQNAGPERVMAMNDLIYHRDYGATLWQVDPTLSKEQATKKYGADKERMDAWKAQRDDWKLIGPDGHRVFNVMRNLYRSHYNNLKRVLEARIDAAVPDGALAKQVKDMIGARLDVNALEVYFPLVREGKYRLEYALKDTAVERERDAFVVERYDTRASMERAAAALKEDPNVVQESIKQHDKEPDIKDLRDTPPTSFVNQTLAILDKTGAKDETKVEITKLFLDTLPETALAKSLQSRKGTSGYIHDALYAMRTKGYDLGRQIVRLEYSAKLQGIKNEIDKLKPEEVKQTATERVAAKVVGKMPVRAVKDELIERIDFAQSGAKNKRLEGVVRALNQTAFIYTLGFNVSSSVTQLAQLPVYIAPMLAGKYGYPESTRELFSAMRLVSGARIGGRAKHAVGKAAERLSIAHGVDAYFDIDDTGRFTIRDDLGLTQAQKAELVELQPVIELAYNRGEMNRSFLLDAVGLEEGGRISNKNAIAQWANKITAISAGMFNQAERFSRQTTLLATYKLALADIQKRNPNIPKKEAQKLAAEQSLYETQITNGGAVLEEAPRFTQQGIMRVALMYKAFGLHMYYNMLRTGKQFVDNAFPGNDAQARELRRMAFRQLLGITGSTVALSGVLGFPLYGLVQMIGDLFLEDDEDDFDTIVRKHIGEGWYKGGITAAFGLDVSSRIGLSNLLFQNNKYNADPSLEEITMSTIGGPALSVANRAMRGFEDLGNGHFMRGVESLIPIGLANFFKAARFGEEGAISRRGDAIFDDFNSFELASQFFGFAPAEYTLRQEQNLRDKNVERSRLEKRKKIMNRYYMAATTGDIDALYEALDDINDFNMKHPEQAISRKTLKQSYKSRLRTSEQSLTGITINPLMRAETLRSREEYGDSDSLIDDLL